MLTKYTQIQPHDLWVTLHDLSEADGRVAGGL